MCCCLYRTTRTLASWSSRSPTPCENTINLYSHRIVLITGSVRNEHSHGIHRFRPTVSLMAFMVSVGRATVLVADTGRLQLGSCGLASNSMSAMWLIQPCDFVFVVLCSHTLQGSREKKTLKTVLTMAVNYCSRNVIVVRPLPPRRAVEFCSPRA